MRGHDLRTPVSETVSMPPPTPRWFLWTGCAAGLMCIGSLLAGCGGGVSDEADVEEADLTEFATESPPANEPAPQAAQSQPAVTPPAAEPAPSGPLPFSTTPVGLIKTVVQQLRQRTPDGWADSQTVLELTVLITPEEAPAAGAPGSAATDPRQGQQRFRVMFQRVRVTQEIAGEPPLSYDSNSPPNPLPASLSPYHDMNKGGFEYWLDRDRQLVEVAGFDQFLERCLRSVPADERASARATLPALSPTEGLACFVDESIGLIPAEVNQPGTTWMRSRQVVQPVAMIASTRYTLQPVSPEIADVEMNGTLAPVSGYPPTGVATGSSEPVQVTVRGGQIIGKCRLDRRSGLPLGSRVEQSLEMSVRLPGGGEFPQFKTTISTVENPASRSTLAALTLPKSLALPPIDEKPSRIDSGMDPDSRRR
jgi:hypothetical protein